MDKQQFPDLIAFPLDQAMQILEKNGVPYYIKKALPFRLSKISKENNNQMQQIICRVIRQLEKSDGIVEILIAPESGAK